LCFLSDRAPPDIYPLSLHDALPISFRPMTAGLPAKAFAFVVIDFLSCVGFPTVDRSSHVGTRVLRVDLQGRRPYHQVRSRIFGVGLDRNITNAEVTRGVGCRSIFNSHVHCASESRARGLRSSAGR